MGENEDVEEHFRLVKELFSWNVFLTGYQIMNSTIEQLRTVLDALKGSQNEKESQDGD